MERLNAALEGRYRIESALGEGGMATVYLGQDIKHERKVVLKVLNPNWLPSSVPNVCTRSMSRPRTIPGARFRTPLVPCPPRVRIGCCPHRRKS